MIQKIEVECKRVRNFFTERAEKTKKALDEIRMDLSKAFHILLCWTTTPIYTNSVWSFMNFCGVS